MKIFIGGSRYIGNKLNEKFVSFLKYEYIHPQNEFIIGDADGVDKIIQKKLNDELIKKVTVYFSRDLGRRNKLNNDWNEMSVGNFQNDIKRFLKRHTKDFQMVIDADIGVMYWHPYYKNRYEKNSLSKGTILNAYNLLKNKKTVFLFDDQTERIISMNKINDLLDYLRNNYSKQLNDRFDKLFKDEIKNFKRFNQDQNEIISKQQSLFDNAIT